MAVGACDKLPGAHATHERVIPLGAGTAASVAARLEVRCTQAPVALLPSRMTLHASDANLTVQAAAGGGGCGSRSRSCRL